MYDGVRDARYAEFMEAAVTHFKHFDGDQSGAIDKAEFVPLFENLQVSSRVASAKPEWPCATPLQHQTLYVCQRGVVGVLVKVVLYFHFAKNITKWFHL